MLESIQGYVSLRKTESYRVIILNIFQINFQRERSP